MQARFCRRGQIVDAYCEESYLESTVAALPAEALSGEEHRLAVRQRKPRAPIRKALGLSVANTVIARAATFVTGIVLARLLTPADFGVYAVALVALTALLSMNELGVSLALVRWPGDPRSIAPTVTTIALSASVLLYVGCWLAAPVVAGALGAPSATGIIRLLCVAVLIDGLTSTPAQLLNRDFRQGRRLIADTANLVVTTAVTLWLAATHHGAWSLAGGQLLGNIVAALLLFHLARAWPRPGFDGAQAAELLRFGVPLAAASALMIAMLNIQYIVAGGLLGEVSLGIYLLAFNLSSWPVNVFSQVVRRVSLAAFARVQEDVVMRQEAFKRMAVLLAVPTLPVCALLGLLALPIVTSVYGSAWKPAATALPFLILFGFMRVVAELSYDFLVALGRSRATLWLQAAWLCALAVALPVGAKVDGIRGVAVAHGLVSVLLMLPANGIAVSRTGVSMRVIGRALARPVAGCALLIVGVLAVRAATEPSIAQLLVGATVGLVIYAPIVWPLRRVLRQLD